MKKVFSFVIALLLMIGVVETLPFSYSVYCVINPTLSITNPGGDAGASSGKISILCNNVNEELNSENLFIEKYSDVAGVDNKFENFMTYSEEKNADDITVGTITLNMSAYKKYNQKDKQKIMSITFSEIMNSDVSQSNKTKIYNFVASQDETVASLVRNLSDDVRADFYGAYSWFAPFNGVIGIALGLMSLAIIVTLGFTISFDLAYLTIPMLNLFLTSHGKDGQPKFVSLEADKAYKEACAASGSVHVDTITTYFKMKSKQMVAISICVLYLVSGRLFVAIASIIDMFSGFLPPVN